MTPDPEQSLRDLQTAFSEWRATRRPRTVPEAIRQQTLAELERHPTGKVLEVLGINHSMIRRWKAQQQEPLLESGLVSLPTSAESAEHVLAHQRLALTIRREGEALALSGELSLEQWRQALSLLQVAP